MQRRESKQRGELRCAGPPSCQWNRTVAMVSALGSFASIANTNGSASSVSASAAAPMEQRLPSTHQLATHAARAWRRVKRSHHELVRSTGHLGEQRAGREPVRERVRQNHLIPGRDRSLSAAVTSAGANAEGGSRQTRSMRSGGRTAITQSSPRRLSDFGATSSRMRSGQTRLMLTKGPGWEREAEREGRELRSHLPAAASRGDVLPRRTFFCARPAVQHRR